jgi:hypothetical protein
LITNSRLKQNPALPPQSKQETHTTTKKKKKKKKRRIPDTRMYAQV